MEDAGEGRNGIKRDLAAVLCVRRGLQRGGLGQRHQSTRQVRIPLSPAPSARVER